MLAAEQPATFQQNPRERSPPRELFHLPLLWNVFKKLCSATTPKKKSWVCKPRRRRHRQPNLTWNSLGKLRLRLTYGKKKGKKTIIKKMEKCGWGHFFQGCWRVCKWSETLRVASGWARGWTGTLHLGHMCLQRGQEKHGPRAKSSLRLFFFLWSKKKKSRKEKKKEKKKMYWVASCPSNHLT